MRQNQGMQHDFYSRPGICTRTCARVGTIACLSAALVWCGGAVAQTANNILGLAPVLQRPATGASAAAAPSAKTAKEDQLAQAKAQDKAKDDATKSVVNGAMTMASSYLGTLATVRVTTSNIYPDAATRSGALAAARLVQRDLRVSCGRQCKPAPMPEPQILADGKLQFDLIIDGYGKTLASPDMISLVQGAPLPVVAKAAKAAASAPETPEKP